MSLNIVRSSLVDMIPAGNENTLRFRGRYAFLNKLTREKIKGILRGNKVREEGK